MAKSIEAYINPEMLAWARESARMPLQRAAKKIGVDPETLKEWEIGKARPTIAKLRRCADTYKRVIAIFFKTEVPPLPKRLRDYRRLPDPDAEMDISAIELEVRRAKLRREQAIYLANSIGQSIPTFLFHTRIGVEIDDLSNRVRSALGIDLETQKSWHDPRQGLRQWILALEARGALIFQASRIPTYSMRGFSISDDVFPVITINGSDAPNGRIFTLMHEVAHLLLDKGGLCDTIEYRNDNSPIQRVEKYCNNFAGSFLVPRESFENEDILRSRANEKAWSDEDFIELSKIYKVSRQVILGRLFHLGRISGTYYQKRLEEYQEQFLASVARKKRGGGDYYQLVIRNNGIAFTNMVLSARDRGILNVGEVSEYLDIKIHQIENVHREFRKFI